MRRHIQILDCPVPTNRSPIAMHSSVTGRGCDTTWLSTYFARYFARHSSRATAKLGKRLL